MSMQSNLCFRNSLNFFRLSSTMGSCIRFANGGIVVTIGKIPLPVSIEHNWNISCIISITSLPWSRSIDPKLITAALCEKVLMAPAIYFTTRFRLCPDRQWPICFCFVPGNVNVYQESISSVGVMGGSYLYIVDGDLCVPFQGRNCHRSICVHI